jgi:hypothetical protein
MAEKGEEMVSKTRISMFPIGWNGRNAWRSGFSPASEPDSPGLDPGIHAQGRAPGSSLDCRVKPGPRVTVRSALPNLEPEDDKGIKRMRLCTRLLDAGRLLDPP